MNKEPYDYKCSNCGKRFRKKDLKDLRGSWHLKDLRGSWHLKDWTCPHCKYQNVTVLTNNKL